MARLKSNAAISFLLFTFILAIYVVSRVSQSADSFWTVPVMVSILTHGDTNLDEYPDLLREKRFMGVECVTSDYRVVDPNGITGCVIGSHYYYWYPIGTPLLGLPLLAAADGVLRIVGPTLDRIAGNHAGAIYHAFFKRDYLASYLLVEVLLSSIITALAAVLLFSHRPSVPGHRPVFGAGDAVRIRHFGVVHRQPGALAARARYAHAVDGTLPAGARGFRRPAILPWAAAPLVVAYFMRPTSSIIFACVTVWVFLYHRQQFARWVLIAALSATPFLAYNLYTYHQPLQSYYMLKLFLAPTPANLPFIFNAFAGNVLSPSRGLFTFSPFLLFCVAGIWLSIRQHWMTPLTCFLAGALALHWILLSVYMFWTAGHCYGPRMFVDVLPLFLFFLIPAFLWLDLDNPRRLRSIVFYVCVFASVFIHFRGANYWAPYEWNGTAGYITPAHAWDWRDPQFLRGVFDQSKK